MKSKMKEKIKYLYECHASPSVAEEGVLGRRRRTPVAVVSSMALPRISHQSRVEFHKTVLRPVLFIMYINDIDVGINNFISKCLDDKKI